MSKKFLLKRSYADVVNSEPEPEEGVEGESVIPAKWNRMSYSAKKSSPKRLTPETQKQEKATLSLADKGHKRKFIFSSLVKEEEDEGKESDTIVISSESDIFPSETSDIVVMESSSDSDSLPDFQMISSSKSPCFMKQEASDSKIGIISDDENTENGITVKDETPFSQCYENDPFLPIYKALKDGIKTKDAVSLLLKKHPDAALARNIPNVIDKNVSFIYSVDSIGHWKNALCDGMGTWLQMGKETTEVHLDDSENITLGKNMSYNSDANLQVIRRKYTNSSCKDLHRVVIVLENKDTNTVLDLIFVQYYFIGDERLIAVNPHRNSKSQTPYKRTNESTRERIKQLCAKDKSTKDIYNTVIEDQGGLEKVKSGTYMAKNKRQITHYRKDKSFSTDPVIECSDLAKGQENSSERFVREVRSAPEFSVFLASDRQLNEIEKFCTGERKFSVLGIDTTFNIGKFYVTITTYRNTMLLTNKDIEPVMIGPVLIHQRKTFDSYFKLTSSMIQEKPNLKNLRVFGTDGDVSLSQACEVCFTNAHHLLCDIHMQDNVHKKLQTLGLSEHSKSIMTDIFGTELGNRKVPGLVDCTSVEAFDKQLDTLIEKWKGLHQNGSRFVQYFTEHKSHLIKQCMTADVRAACGLGFPPKPYTQNANECINAVLKSDIKSMKVNKNDPEVDPYECVRIIEKIVKRQENDVKLALIGKGPLCLKDEYKHLGVHEDVYWKKNPKQREAVYKRMLLEPVMSQDRNECHNFQGFTASEEEFAPHIPRNIVSKMLQDAKAILQDETNIVSVPGQKNAVYLVFDIQSKDTRQVLINKQTKKLTCEAKKCHNWNAFKMCSHIISLADKLDMLSDVLQKHKNLNKSYNVTNMVNTNMSASRGKKGVKATQIRKGPANKTKPVLVDYAEVNATESSCNIGASYSELKLSTAKETAHDVFEITFIHGVIKKCYGCEGQFSPKERARPYDLLVKHLEVRPRFQNDARKFYIPGTKDKSNAYYHLNAECVKRIHKDFDLSKVIIPLQIQNSLSDEHKDVLRLAGVKL